mmetsp:Transcript_28323/g.67031  ORF Transcript_28323/g.67031 Transcript_28323/m.67031 type:complete len:252 (-) Transcript_28323:4-759(-)
MPPRLQVGGVQCPQHDVGRCSGRPTMMLPPPILPSPSSPPFIPAGHLIARRDRDGRRGGCADAGVEVMGVCLRDGVSVHRVSRLRPGTARAGSLGRVGAVSSCSGCERGAVRVLSHPNHHVGSRCNRGPWRPRHLALGSAALSSQGADAGCICVRRRQWSRGAEVECKRIVQTLEILIHKTQQPFLLREKHSLLAEIDAGDGGMACGAERDKGRWRSIHTRHLSVQTTWVLVGRRVSCMEGVCCLLLRPRL